MEQRTSEWFESRIGKVTASRFGCLAKKLGSGSETYMREILAELVAPSEGYTNEFIEHGVENEARAILEYEASTLNMVDRVGFVEYAGQNELLCRYVGGSPDGLVDDDGLIEVKCPKTTTVVDFALNRNIEPKYMAQMQGLMWITDRKWCDYIIFDPRITRPELRLIVTRVDRDDDYISRLEANLIEFCKKLDRAIKYLNLI